MKEELQSAVKLYSITHHREFVVSKSNKTLYTVVCKLKPDRCDCGWRLYACKNKQDLFEIKKVTEPHTCVNQQPNKGHKQLTNYLVEAVKIKFEYTISYWKAWHAKQHALRFLFGDLKEAYNLLPELMAAVYSANPTTNYSFWRGPVNRASEEEFEGLFWAFGSSIQGFQFCKPVITVDGTFLTGKYQRCLLMAVASDADGQLLPLSFALVDKERLRRGLGFRVFAYFDRPSQ